MMLGMILLIVLLLLAVGTLPTWPHSRSWGYKPTAGIGIVLIIAVVFIAMDRNGMMGHSSFN
jgi:Protein of unknown function (DUF3309)